MFVSPLLHSRTSALELCQKRQACHGFFAGPARTSQCCVLTGLKVGTPVETKRGVDVMTSKGRRRVMEIFRRTSAAQGAGVQTRQQDQKRSALFPNG